MLTRIVTALIGAPLVIAVVVWAGGDQPFPGWPFALLVLAMILVGLREFYDGCRRAGLDPRDEFGYMAGVYLLLLATPLIRERAMPEVRLGLPLLVMVSLVVETMRSDRAPLRSLSPTWLGALYVGLLLPFALRLRLLTVVDTGGMRWVLPPGIWTTIGPGPLLLLFTWLVTAAVDTGAYAFGKAIGKHKLAPVLSPGKTWEGSIGGVVTALLIAWGIAVWWRIPLTFALTAAALIAVLAQFGDLSKSAVKREIGIKDFGALLPGHGGVLDRFDSLMFTAPAVYWLLILWR